MNRFRYRGQGWCGYPHPYPPYPPHRGPPWSDYPDLPPGRGYPGPRGPPPTWSEEDELKMLEEEEMALDEELTALRQRLKELRQEATAAATKEVD